MFTVYFLVACQPPLTSLILLLLLEMVLLTHLEMASVNMEENLAGSLLEDNRSVRLIRGSVPGADTFFGGATFIFGMAFV